MKSPATLTVNIKTNCKSEALAKAEQFRAMFYTNTDYPYVHARQADSEFYVVCMSLDETACLDTLEKRVVSFQPQVSTDALSLAVDSALRDGFSHTSEHSAPNLIWFFAVLLTAICSLSYCSQQHELELAQQEAAVCQQ